MDPKPMDLKPGQTVTVTLSKNPTNLAAHKTVSRVFRHDPAIGRFQDKRKNPILDWRGWGGRIKPVRTRGSAQRLPKLGATCTFVVDSAKIADLASVQRFITVSAVPA